MFTLTEKTTTKYYNFLKSKIKKRNEQKRIKKKLINHNQHAITLKKIYNKKFRISISKQLLAHKIIETFNKI